MQTCCTSAAAAAAAVHQHAPHSAASNALLLPRRALFAFLYEVLLLSGPCFSFVLLTSVLEHDG
jgi:hypothetical protein